MPLLQSLFAPPKVPQVPLESEETPTNKTGSPVTFRNTSHKTGIPIAAFDISPDRAHAVLAGRDILKTIQVSDFACAEDFNLRTNIIAYAATREDSGGAVSAKHKDQLAANDVKWSHGNFSTTIATAVPNGQIVVYDINRPGVEMARLHEHSRQVHRLGFNPHQGHRMLSGSQDGTVRMWDLRDLAKDRSVMICQSLEKYQCNRDGIRDVKWSPTNGVEFAVGTDDGSVQRWDFRYSKGPSLSVKAHEKSCYSIDWHPDGKHLVSGGGDKNIMIWDFSSSNRKMKPSWNIRAPQAVLNVCWRPPCWSSDEKSLPGWQCTQLAASYDQQEPQLHIWDFRRPYVPFRILDQYNTPATASLWRSESLLWSVGSAGMFTQTDINSAPRAMDRRSPNVLAIAPDSKILFFLQKRELRRPSIEDALENLNQQDQRRASTSEQLSGSQGTAQGSSEEPKLQSSWVKNRRKYPSFSKPAKSLGGTPPSAGSGGPVLRLDKSLDKKYRYHSSQVGGIGYIEGLFDAPDFKLLARYYKVPPPMPTDAMGCDLHLQLSNALRANAALGERTSQYRLSQSWLVLALAVEKELHVRAESNYQKRKKATATATSLKDFAHQASLQSTKKDVDILSDLHNDLSLSVRDAPRTKHVKSNALDNASNMTAPLARPVPDSLVGLGSHANVDSFQLPDSTWNKQPPKPVAGVSGLARIASPKSPRMDTAYSHEHSEHIDSVLENEGTSPKRIRQRPSDTGLVDMDRQMAERRAAIGNYRAMRRPLLRLDEPIQLTGSGLNVATFGRHDSNESFQLFSASTDSSHRGQSIPGSFESNNNSGKSTSTPERAHSVDRQEDYDASDQDETALMFDDEAQMRSPRAVPNSASPPNVVDAQSKETTEPTGADTRSPLLRPTNFLQPIIHYEDMEELGTPAQAVVADTVIDSHKYILSDFLPPEEAQEYLPPWTATAMFEPLIDFHQYKLKDAQLPAYMLLHLGPYINHSIHHNRSTQIFLFYHSQLVSLELYTQAAELRKLCQERYPYVAEKGLYDITPGGPWCTVCRKPNKGDEHTKPKFCERCKQSWAECPICNGEGPISEERPLGPNKALNTTVTNVRAGDRLWGWCQDCGHGGHTGCLRTWWDFGESEGACPTVGCLCDCMPGTRRDESIKVKRLEEDKKRKVVSKDEWTVRPSPAAQKARSMMSGGPGGAKGTWVGRGVMSLAGAGRSASGGKKVRIVAPEEEERGNGKENDTPSASAP